MKKEIKLKNILLGKQAVEKLLSQNLPIKTSFNILKIANKYKDELELIESRRVELIKKYDPEGKSVPVEKHKEFFTEWNDFLEGETISVEFKKIDVDTLSDEIRLTPDELNSIEYLFDGLDEQDVEDLDVDVI